MPHSVTVTTGSRLHFGPLSYGNATGRQFGGVGVMIDTPACRVVVTESNDDEVVAPDSIREAVVKTIGRWAATRGVYSGPVRVKVPEVIPRHRGFGSGTQLALAVGTALEVLWFRRADFLVRPNGEQVTFDRADLEVRPTDMAARLGRGKRSAIGIHGFAHGGFLLDAGKSRGTPPVGVHEIGSLAERVAFPEDWRFVLITPPGTTGLRGGKEEAAFRELSPMPDATTAKLRRLASEVLLPAVQNADFEQFAPALFEFGATVGDFFAPVQGGRFAHPAAEQLVKELHGLGKPAVAQSSWGPTLAAVVEDVTEAESLMTFLKQSATWGDSAIRLGKPRNRPAVVAIGS